MKVLVTGATGFIGRIVVQVLLERGHSVIALVRDIDKASNMNWWNKVECILHDVHSPRGIELRALGQPDVLFHLAWSGLPNYRSLFHYEENLPASYQFIKSLVEQGLRQVLVTGTCLEYGMRAGCLHESMTTDPVVPYALAKDVLRKYLQFLQRELPFVLQWARIFYVYGEGQNSRSLLAQLDKAIDRGEESFDMSAGEQLRDYLSVDEVAMRIVDLAEHCEADGIFNVCSGQPVSIRRLVEIHLKRRRASMELNLGCYPYPV